MAPRKTSARMIACVERRMEKIAKLKDPNLHCTTTGVELLDCLCDCSTSFSKSNTVCGLAGMHLSAHFKC